MSKAKSTPASDAPLFFHQDALFLNSPEGRDVRVLSELMGPAVRFEKYGIHHTIVFFGSARTLGTKDVAKQIAKASKENNSERLLVLRRLEKLAPYYDAARELGKKIGKWNKKQSTKYAICTGGGPGIMEAGNRGAQDAGEPNIGLNIKLPFEQHPNPYLTPELSVHFNYFFVRKYWFLYMAKALVIFPGGYGTLDELFETLTLIQTKKMIKPIPIVLFGSEYWKKLVNFDLMVETGMIDPDDLKLFKFIDDVDEAFEYVTSKIEENAEVLQKHMHRTDGNPKPFF
jgi:uncharacterized protein (TIGR00730 family)